MTMYKIISNSIVKRGNTFFPVSDDCSEYKQFVQDVAEQGTEIVEGPDIIEPSYSVLRQQEYPSYADQFDQIYHDGIETWKASIQEIKDKYPKTITGGVAIGEIPSWVQEVADNWTFNKQLREYAGAVERLSQYILSEGRPETRNEVVVFTEEVINEETGEMETIETTQEVITQTAIEPLPEFIDSIETDPETLEPTTVTIRNPAIVRDEEERAAAEVIISSTPQEVIDAFNSWV